MFCKCKRVGGEDTSTRPRQAGANHDGRWGRLDNNRVTTPIPLFRARQLIHEWKGGAITTATLEADRSRLRDIRVEGVHALLEALEEARRQGITEVEVEARGDTWSTPIPSDPASQAPGASGDTPGR